jgi:hypothetical protein
MDEWKASTPQDLQEKLPGMYNLLTRGVTSMKLISVDGVLPGTGSAVGATATYNPSSQSCSSGCGLDGSGCGELGNIRGDVNHCNNYKGATLNLNQESFSAGVVVAHQYRHLLLLNLMGLVLI